MGVAAGREGPKDTAENERAERQSSSWGARPSSAPIRAARDAPSRRRGARGRSCRSARARRPRRRARRRTRGRPSSGRNARRGSEPPTSRRARPARSARASWRNPTAPLMTTITTIVAASARSPRRAATTHAPIESSTSALRNWPRKRRMADDGQPRGLGRRQSRRHACPLDILRRTRGRGRGHASPCSADAMQLGAPPWVERA